MWVCKKVCLAILVMGACQAASSVVAGERGARLWVPERSFASEAAPAGKKRNFHKGISLEEAVGRLRERTGGRILSAEELDSEYRIRLLTPEGVVRRLRIDPDTGRILR